MKGKVDQRRIIKINWQADNRVCRSGDRAGRQDDETVQWKEEGEKRSRDKTRRNEPGSGQVRPGQVRQRWCSMPDENRDSGFGVGQR